MAYLRMVFLLLCHDVNDNGNGGDGTDVTGVFWWKRRLE